MFWREKVKEGIITGKLFIYFIIYISIRREFMRFPSSSPKQPPIPPRAHYYRHIYIYICMYNGHVHEKISIYIQQTRLV